jgi:hypothetical protein
VLALAWTTILFVMDLTTARPGIVSHDQILRSDAIVVGRRKGPASDRISVVRVFRGPVEEGDEVRVRNLVDVRDMAADRDYILALSQVREDFVVTKLEGQRAPPLVYASSPANIDEIKSILRDRHL